MNEEDAIKLGWIVPGAKPRPKVVQPKQVEAVSPSGGTTTSGTPSSDNRSSTDLFQSNSKIIAVFLIGILAGIFIMTMDFDLNSFNEEDVLTKLDVDVDELNRQADAALDLEPLKNGDQEQDVAAQGNGSPHTGAGFGGIHNVAHPGGAKHASENPDLYSDIIIPTSNVGHAIESLNLPNIINHWGHYVHDEHRSPYASHLYNKTKEFLEEQQTKFVEKMKKVRQEWGVWDFQDEQQRPVVDFSKAAYRDLPVSEFPPNAWQSDKNYLDKFLNQATALVDRMQEGIYAEYGWPKMKKDGTERTPEEIKEREEAFQIHIEPTDPPKTGVGTLSQGAFDGLVRKLLHAMVTNDEFYTVLGGHSAAAGHGNNFQQNRIITYQYIMEPVFAKLGMRLISRNMGMGGVGTLQFSLAGGDLYGETDFLEWDSGMTEKGPAVDLFNKQAILSGERVPVIMTDYHFKIMEETKDKAWMGKYISDNSMMPETTLENQDTIPYAARWINQKEEKYNAICWEPRSDFEPEKAQSNHPGSQVGWHPGNRVHQWSGRKTAMVILKALKAALKQWQDAIEEEGAPLAEKYWHVGEHYKTIRENLRTHITTPKEGEEDVRSDCEKLIPYIPRICRVQMHGYGMWNPRAHINYDFLNLIHPAPNGYKPDWPQANAYNGFDLMPSNQAVPDGDVDVHAIAIASTNPAPDLDHSWTEDNEGGSRRWLREASRDAFQRGSVEIVNATIPKTKNFTTNLRRELQEDIVPGRGWEVSSLWINRLDPTFQQY